jgi:hypothetical protein
MTLPESLILVDPTDKARAAWIAVVRLPVRQPSVRQSLVRQRIRGSMQNHR